MNDIKAQVNKGRFVRVNYLSGVVHYVLMKMSKKMMGMKFISPYDTEDVKTALL